MRPSFLPRLVNSPFDDPALFVPSPLSGRALIFDLGDLHALPARDALKITHAFVTHTHMDHFAGFDRLLRLFLGRDKLLNLYGPPGFLKNVAGKLSAYTWNLVQNGDSRFALHVTEVHADHVRSCRYRCRRGFLQDEPAEERAWGGVLCREAEFSVSAVLLDHETACLGFALEEPFHVNIIREALGDLGLEVGPWLSRFKHALYAGREAGKPFCIGEDLPAKAERTFKLGDLAARIARITAGQKIAYIMDTGYSRENVGRIIGLCRGADHLFIEGGFLERDREIAARKHHLTARQAGIIAARAGARKLTVCHFSPRYDGLGHLLEEEAAAAFEDARLNS